MPVTRCIVALALLMLSACSRPDRADVRSFPAKQEYSGLLSSYAKLQPSPTFENTRVYVSNDAATNIHRYVAIIVDEPAVYVSSDVDRKAISDNAVRAVKEYFQAAILDAVEDAFPVVQSQGPLVLRLRSALVGVDVGHNADGSDANKHTLNIGKVGVEMELLDSETGAQIAAVVDHQNLGEGAEIGSNLSREQKFRAATDAIDGWASRLRQFLDSAHELSNDDVAHVEATNFPYASSDQSKQR
jgi:uncharacterized protein DUF3313